MIRSSTHPANRNAGLGAVPRALGLFLFGTCSVVLAIVAWLWEDLGTPWGAGVSAAVAYGIFTLHLTLSRRVLNPFDPVIWIPGLMLLFYFGMPVAIELLGDPSFQTYDAWKLGEPPKLAQGAVAGLLTLVAYLFGIYLAGPRNLSDDPRVRNERWRSLTGPGISLIGLGYAMLLFGLAIAGPSLVFGDYAQFKAVQDFAAADLRFFNIGLLFIPAGVFAVLASHSRARRGWTWLALGALIPVTIVLLATGDRGGLSALAFSTGWVFSQRVRRIGFGPVIAGFVIAFLLMPMIKQFREYKDLPELAKGLNPRHLAAMTFYEMGSTLQIFCYTLEYIPERKPYDLGLTVVNPLIELIPNVGFTVGRSVVLDPLEHGPGRWITSTVRPDIYAEGGGLAYAVGAEWYFNFGFTGILLGMAALGFLTTAVRNRSRDGPLWLVWSALFFGGMALLTRNTLAYPLRSVVWPFTAVAVLSSAWPTRYQGSEARHMEPLKGEL